MTLPTWKTDFLLLCQNLPSDYQVKCFGKSQYKIPWASSWCLFASKYAVSIDSSTPGLLTIRSTLSHLWNATMCMSGRWSCYTGGWFLLKSKPYILHSASRGVTHRASLYCLISSMFPFSSALSVSLITTDVLSCPLYMYLNRYFTDLMLPQASTLIWQLKVRSRQGL